MTLLFCVKVDLTTSSSDSASETSASESGGEGDSLPLTVSSSISASDQSGGERYSLPTVIVAALTLTTTLFVCLPVGVVIGYCSNNLIVKS